MKANELPDSNKLDKSESLIPCSFAMLEAERILHTFFLMSECRFDEKDNQHVSPKKKETSTAMYWLVVQKFQITILAIFSFCILMDWLCYHYLFGLGLCLLLSILFFIMITHYIALLHYPAIMYFVDAPKHGFALKLIDV